MLPAFTVDHAPGKAIAMTKRPRLYLAQSQDRKAQTSIIVLELRGQPSLYWEQVVREQGSTFASPSSQVELALKFAREEGLRDFDLFLMGRSGMLGALHDPDLGHVRIRWIARRKNLNARPRAPEFVRPEGRGVRTP
jgi:hypothetical protein